ncbi:MAG: SGNH/GDSL hydrolase family protein [Candidatus Shapirobacteria bacterium]|jgi:lysophospholipase L1-like esterase
MKLPSVFIVGDSISIGYDPYLRKYLKGKFWYSRKLGTKETFWNPGTPMSANGGDSSLVLKYLQNNHKHKEIPKVNYLLFNCGLHDIKTNPITEKKQITISRYRENLRLILQKANKFTNYIVWVNSTPVNDTWHNTRCKDFSRYNKDVLEYNCAAKKIMQKHKIPTIDLYSLTLKFGQNLYTDHIHFKKTIYQKLGRYIAFFLYKQHHLNIT